MRVPDELKSCVCFLCVDERDGGSKKRRYAGTAFFVSVPCVGTPEKGHVYAVTAKHCIENAKVYDALYLRVNALDGGARFVKVDTRWIYPEDTAADVAVLPLGDVEGLDYATLPVEMFLTGDLIRRRRIGIGDELIIAGLFTKHYGQNRNIPIVRSGIIAAMPDEPLVDDSGLEYDAYLAEVRSAGGLSGSPVLVRIFPARLDPTDPDGLQQQFLLGLVRGHWDYEASESAIDYTRDELQALNTGIAIVTPIQEVASVLQCEELTKQRQQEDEELLKQASSSGQKNGRDLG
jgi:hypothetical protein